MADIETLLKDKAVLREYKISPPDDVDDRDFFSKVLSDDDSHLPASILSALSTPPRTPPARGSVQTVRSRPSTLSPSRANKRSRGSSFGNSDSVSSTLDTYVRPISAIATINENIAHQSPHTVGFVDSVFDAFMDSDESDENGATVPEHRKLRHTVSRSGLASSADPEARKRLRERIAAQLLDTRRPGDPLVTTHIDSGSSTDSEAAAADGGTAHGLDTLSTTPNDTLSLSATSLVGLMHARKSAKILASRLQRRKRGVSINVNSLKLDSPVLAPFVAPQSVPGSEEFSRRWSSKHLLALRSPTTATFGDSSHGSLLEDSHEGSFVLSPSGEFIDRRSLVEIDADCFFVGPYFRLWTTFVKVQKFRRRVVGPEFRAWRQLLTIRQFSLQRSAHVFTAWANCSRVLENRLRKARVLASLWNTLVVLRTFRAWREAAVRQRETRVFALAFCASKDKATLARFFAGWLEYIRTERILRGFKATYKYQTAQRVLRAWAYYARTCRHIRRRSLVYRASAYGEIPPLDPPPPALSFMSGEVYEKLCQLDRVEHYVRCRVYREWIPSVFAAWKFYVEYSKMERFAIKLYYRRLRVRTFDMWVTAVKDKRRNKVLARRAEEQQARDQLKRRQAYRPVDVRAREYLERRKAQHRALVSEQKALYLQVMDMNRTLRAESESRALGDRERERFYDELHSEVNTFLNAQKQRDLQKRTDSAFQFAGAVTAFKRNAAEHILICLDEIAFEVEDLHRERVVKMCFRALAANVYWRRATRHHLFISFRAWYRYTRKQRYRRDLAVIVNRCFVSYEWRAFQHWRKHTLVTRQFKCSDSALELQRRLQLASRHRSVMGILSDMYYVYNAHGMFTLWLRNVQRELIAQRVVVLFTRLREVRSMRRHLRAWLKISVQTPSLGNIGRQELDLAIETEWWTRALVSLQLGASDLVRTDVEWESGQWHVAYHLIKWRASIQRRLHTEAQLLHTFIGAGSKNEKSMFTVSEREKDVMEQFYRGAQLCWRACSMFGLDATRRAGGSRVDRLTPFVTVRLASLIFEKRIEKLVDESAIALPKQRSYFRYVVALSKREPARDPWEAVMGVERPEESEDGSSLSW